MVAVGDVPLKDHGQGVMDLIASDAVLDEAYAWLCVRRKDYSPHDDVLPRRESFASLHILTRRASEGSEALPSLARRVRMCFFGARVISFSSLDHASGSSARSSGRIGKAGGSNIRQRAE